MFTFNRDLWQKNQSRFAQNHQTTCSTVREVGYSEMTVHRFLMPDRSVQETACANGTKVTVNFGNAAFRLSANVSVAPMGHRVEKSE